MIAGLSIGDMVRERPYDGVVLEADTPGRLMVRKVVPGTGAAAAGIQKGDQIVGIDRNVLRSTVHAAKLLNQYNIGDDVSYLVRHGGTNKLREVSVSLGPRRMGSATYLYASLLGFSFFFVGLWVLLRQPRLRVSQIFFIQSTLFLLFLVCRLRPASYTWIDTFVLTTGMVAMLFLPAAFLHFFLIFPRPISLRPSLSDARYRPKRRRWLALLTLIYLIPPAVLLAVLWIVSTSDRSLALISGAPAANWWTLAAYIITGLGVLAVKTWRLGKARERRGAALVLFGSVFGLLPFLFTAVFRPEALHSDRLLLFSLAPLILVPLTFAVAIVMFGLLEIRVILRKSLLYTATTAVVTVVYAAGIALFNALARGTEVADSPLFPIFFALAIVLLFEPVRRRLQKLVERYFYAGRGRLEQSLEEIGEAFSSATDPKVVVGDLVEELPRRLGLDFAGLYLHREGRIERVAGPRRLPTRLPTAPWLFDRLMHRRGLVRLEELEALTDGRAEVASVVDTLRRCGVGIVGALASARRRVGLILLPEQGGQLGFDESELNLLRQLFQQAALALETGQLIEERTQQAELQRELEIASSVQSEILPSRLDLGTGWRVAAHCRPAQHIGGDFFAELPGPQSESKALIWGDVAGKSVSGALLMMAAHEVLQSLALTHRDPETLLALANQRLYGLGRRSFVALGYLTCSPTAQGVEYALAGQPPPMLRECSGRVRELPLPENRLPLGALINGSYQMSFAPMSVGEVLLGYSDGVVEAISPRGEMFGNERLSSVVSGSPGEPQAVVDNVISALEEFTEGREPYDDVTLVAVACDREA